MVFERFYKYHGAGNDFILIEDFSREYTFRDKGPFAQMCHRQYGVGADGIILLQPSRVADLRMRIFNADGGEATMCGNGLRCLVKHFGRSHVSVETASGIALGALEGDKVRATLPKQEVILSPLALEEGQEGHLLNTGAPHLIVFKDSVEVEGFAAFGRKYRNHELFAPDGVNVSIATYDGEEIALRTYEKGVERETLACGTAAASAFLVLRQKDPQLTECRVRLRSGDDLKFSFDLKNHLWMEGPATLVYEGKFVFQKEESLYTVGR